MIKNGYKINGLKQAQTLSFIHTKKSWKKRKEYQYPSQLFIAKK